MTAVLNGLLWLLGCQLAGETLVALTGVPVPGPVIGMVLLFVVLQVRRPAEDSPVLATCDKLLRHLQVFFIPPGVGFMVYLGTVRDEAVPLVVAMLVSWAAALATVALLVVLLTRRSAAT